MTMKIWDYRFAGNCPNFVWILFDLISPVFFKPLYLNLSSFHQGIMEFYYNKMLASLNLKIQKKYNHKGNLHYLLAQLWIIFQKVKYQNMCCWVDFLLGLKSFNPKKITFPWNTSNRIVGNKSIAYLVSGGDWSMTLRF